MSLASTTAARAAFRVQYGHESYEVIRLMCEGYSKPAIEDITGVPSLSLDAYQANLTRGTYDHVLDECNFAPRWSNPARRVVQLLREDKSTYEIARTLHMRRTKVAAYAANFTRGAYDLMS